MDNVKMEPSEKAEQTPGFLLWQVSKLWQRHLAMALRDLQISSTQAVILGYIVRLTQEQKRVTQIMLSETTKVDPMTTSQAIRTLEKKKLIKRVIAEKDKRAYYVLPTKSGEDAYLEARERIIEVHQSFFKPLEKDKEIFTTSLEKLIEANET